MIELVLKILLAVFTVFGFYAFAHALCAWLFRNDHIRLTVLVDSAEVAEQIDLYIDEAKSARFSFGKTEIFAVVMEKYATKELLEFLKRKRISFLLATENGEDESFERRAKWKT